ncbi:MAG: MarR family transcriptional regulator [Solirubrobacterales bacterium]|nr:MarR family transcriptional regulator [Solirubrobacterales bacterium]
MAPGLSQLMGRHTLSITAAKPHTDAATRLRATVGRIHRRLRPTAAGAAAGLTPTRISLLVTIARLGPIRLSDLAAEEGINPTMLSRIVSDLVEGGLIERIGDPEDRRAALVKTTREGRRVIERMRRERTDVLSVALESLSPGERRQLERALPALERLAEKLKEGGR